MNTENHIESNAKTGDRKMKNQRIMIEVSLRDAKEVQDIIHDRIELSDEFHQEFSNTWLSEQMDREILEEVWDDAEEALKGLEAEITIQDC